MKKTLLIILCSLLIAYCLTGCATCPPATPENVRKWEHRHKFKASTRQCDSLRHTRMLAMARKY